MKKAMFTLVCSASFPSSPSKPDMSRLRLAAACALLKLAQEPCYHEIITLEQYQLCALVINVRTTLSHFFTSYCSYMRNCYQSLCSLQTHLCTCIPFHHPSLPPNYSHYFLCVFIFADRMSATRCDSVFPRSSTGAYVASVCPWNTWRCLLCVPRTLSKRGGLTLASAWWKTSTYAESTSNSTLPSAVKKQKN